MQTQLKEEEKKKSVGVRLHQLKHFLVKRSNSPILHRCIVGLILGLPSFMLVLVTKVWAVGQGLDKSIMECLYPFFVNFVP